MWYVKADQSCNTWSQLKSTPAPCKVKTWGPKAWSVEMVHSPWRLFGLVTRTCLGVFETPSPVIKSHIAMVLKVNETLPLLNRPKNRLESGICCGKIWTEITILLVVSGSKCRDMPRILAEVRTQALCHTIKLRQSKWHGLLASRCSIGISVNIFSYTELVETSLTRMVWNDSNSKFNDSCRLEATWNHLCR